MKNKYLFSLMLSTLICFTSFSQVAQTNSDVIPTEQKSMASTDKFSIDLINKSGPSRQMLVGYVSNATLGFDRLYDGKVFGSSTVMIYSFVYDDLDDQKLCIQGRPYPEFGDEVIPIGIEISEGLSPENKIQFAFCGGAFVDVDVLLVDKEACETHNLLSGAYEFTAGSGTYLDRFEIVFKSEIFQVLNTTSVEGEREEKVDINLKNGAFTVSSGSHEIERITIYSLCGQLIFSKDYKGFEREVAINSIKSSSEVLIVETLLNNGVSVTRKVVF